MHMATLSSFLFSKPTLFQTSSNSKQKQSFRHYNKHLQCNSLPNKKLNIFTHKKAFFTTQKSHFIHPIKSSFSHTVPEQNPVNNVVSFNTFKDTLLSLTPIKLTKWSIFMTLSLVFTKKVLEFSVNPFVWMYFSWTWLFWPWYVAIAIGIYGIYSFNKHMKNESNVVEQVGIVTSIFTWLTLVPPACFNGYLEGWPFVFFFVYHYFFFLHVSIRKRMYGDYYLRDHDKKWDVNVPRIYTVLFSVGVMVSHWLAAYEGTELHLVPGGWNNVFIWGFIMVTIFAQYNAQLYLAKYSENIFEPTSVVQFGPYRWVRHPIYGSTMLLFATYFAALRAPMSLLFVVGVCVAYYDQKVKKEEALMVETFGERYLEYANKVRYKFIPFVY